MTVSSSERGFLLISIADSHLMIGTDEVELGELFISS